MSYSIIFQTKIAKLPDGRIIHFDRSGCNNDTEGRTQGEFTAKVYTEDEFIWRAEGFMKDSRPYKESQSFELKIGSRYASYYDYGEHLLRMLKRAKSIEDIIANSFFSAEYVESVDLVKPYKQTMTAAEFDKVFYKLLYGDGGLSYRTNMKYLYDAESLVAALDAGEHIVARIR